MRIFVAAFLFIALASTSALAQGFGIYEQGSCAMGRAGAGVAEPCDDGSAIFLNPAGLAGRRGPVISGGATLISGTAEFESDDGVTTESDSSLEFPPHVYFSYGLSERFAVGAGLYVPYGLGVRWPLSFSGRFVSFDSDLKTFYIQPSIAYATANGRVSVGGGLTIALSRVNLVRREDLALVPLGISNLTFGALLNTQTDFANTELSSPTSTGFGANIGLIVKASERVRVGVRYLTRVTLSYEGTATFTAVPGSFVVTKTNPLGLPIGTPLDASVAQVVASLQDQPVTTELPMPAQFIAGTSFHATPRVTLFGDYQWTQWSSFDAVTLDFSLPVPADETLAQNYDDTHAIRIGAEFVSRPALTFRGGYAFNTAAAPDETVTPLLPEAQRNHFTGGVTWMVSPQVSLDLAYQFIAHADRRGRTVNPPAGSLPTVDLNSGIYRSRGDLVGITLTYRP
jgi:long-chain fatty acid transport protein